MSAWLLVAEDDPDDRELLRLAFAEHALGCDYEMVTDGQAARERLLQAAGEGRPPAALLTDLKLPRMSGLELLDWVVAQEPLRGLPKAVLTSSSEARDRAACEALGCALFMQKPEDLDGYGAVVARLKSLLPPA